MNLKQLVTSTVGAGACTPTAQLSLPKPSICRLCSSFLSVALIKQTKSNLRKERFYFTL